MNEVKETYTNRLYVGCVNQSYSKTTWLIGSSVPSSGALFRIYTVWLEEFDPDYVITRNSKGIYYAYRADIERHGKFGQDEHGIYYTLPRTWWHKVDIPCSPESRSAT